MKKIIKNIFILIVLIPVIFLLSWLAFSAIDIIIKNNTRDYYLSNYNIISVYYDVLPDIINDFFIRINGIVYIK